MGNAVKVAGNTFDSTASGVGNVAASTMAGTGGGAAMQGGRVVIALTMPACVFAREFAPLVIFYQFVLLSVQLCFGGLLQGLSHIFLETLLADFLVNDALLENPSILEKFLDQRSTILHALYYMVTLKCCDSNCYCGGSNYLLS